MSLAITRALAAPESAFEVHDDSEFPLQFSAVNDDSGLPWRRISYLRVALAGQITVKFARPRQGHSTETFTLGNGEELEGQIAEIVAADGPCFPLKVFR